MPMTDVVKFRSVRVFPEAFVGTARYWKSCRTSHLSLVAFTSSEWIPRCGCGTPVGLEPRTKLACYVIRGGPREIRNLCRLIEKWN